MEEIDGAPARQKTLSGWLPGRSGGKSKSQRKAEIGAAFLASKDRQTRTAQAVNPFLTDMFFKISFKNLETSTVHVPPHGGRVGNPGFIINWGRDAIFKSSWIVNILNVVMFPR